MLYARGSLLLCSYMAAIEILLSISEILQGGKDIMVFKKMNKNNHETSFFF